MSLEERQDVEIATERLVFFSDADLAIALTLLVIDLRVPDLVGSVTDRRLASALAEDLPRVFSYALSFAVIGMYWLAHWPGTPSSVVSTRRSSCSTCCCWGSSPRSRSRPRCWASTATSRAVVLYAGLLAAAGLAGTAGWLYVTRKGLMRPGVTRTEVRVGTLRGLAVPVVMLGSLAILPFWGPGPVELAWLLIIPLHWLIARWATRADVEQGGRASNSGPSLSAVSGPEPRARR